MRLRPAHARAAGALAACALAAGCQGWGLDPDFERMIDQTKAEPFERTPLLPGERVNQAPPAGTVAQEHVIGSAAVTEGLARGQYAAALPLPVTRDLLELGRARFQVICAACHGMLGDGQSKVAENMRLRKPPSLHAEAIRAYPPGRIFQVVSHGYGLMPANADRLTLEERWAVVAYVKALQLSQAVPLAELPPAVRREAEQVLK